ncbi:transglycosylase domain-containing protein [Aerococcus kribbianus]|uniref:PBP1A family penicillin-binding protein n=1 Tax=Aerococcus kribbianus TaxID=2999064 RepID=A0A9X3FQN7_9LACT|nr:MULTISPECIES: PBP1A family penicillin-binding protein [unclassified Aerococcus]MCZ0717797.1 PBP1A family penicillin-binding protein [Aerococcus sp. YH-aer221]MCZ0726084.1 PBP1A family penicillin-binding protein [Aerococcus sp. YH-aer222]
MTKEKRQARTFKQKPWEQMTAWEKFKYYWKKWYLTRWIIFAVLLFAFVFESYLVVSAKMTDVSNLQEQLQETTEIYDQENNLAGELASNHGTYVSLDAISSEMQTALISTEDKRFYQHPGFDVIGIGRAAFGYVLHGGQIVGGGSTITQQLVKNAFLTNDQTLLRKFKELFLSLEVEKHFTKDQILEMYLNNSYFGNGVYGVEDASQKYFGKSAQDLELPEGAVLAGAVKGPSVYNPVDDYDATLERRNLVLETMANNGFISGEQANAAIYTDMPQQNNPIDNDAYQYPYYFDAVIEEAINKFGISEEELMNKGYRIYTTLNSAYQEQVQDVYNQTDLFPMAPSGEISQSATVIMDPYTGGVLATVGGTGGHNFRGFNRATQMYRQPGSVIKPLNVYATALANGYSANDILPDEVKSYGADDYTPQNADYQTQGEIMLWDAVAKSKNTSAVWLMNELGVNKTMKTLEGFGIPYSDADMNLSSALGGLSKGVTPVEVASAYTAFDNKGVRSQAYFISRIEDSDVNVIVEEQKPQQNQAVSADVANEMTSILQATYDEGGTGASVEPDGVELAGKTGTVEISVDGVEDGVNDQWHVAYTPDFVSVSWFGFDETNQENYLWAYSPSSSYEVTRTILDQVVAVSPNTPFQVESAKALYEASQNYEDPESSDSSDTSEESSDSEPGIIDRIFEGGRDFLDGLFGQTG